MNKSLYVLLTVFPLLVSACFADDARPIKWGAMTNSALMSANLKGGNTEIKYGEPLVLSIMIKNISTNETFDGEYMYLDDHDLSFVVISPSGKNISPVFKHGPTGFYSGPSGGFNVFPNQTSEIQFYLSNICDFHKIGTYKITAKQRLHANPGKKEFVVVSDTLTVSVIPSDQ